MINADMREYDFYTYGDSDSYGQSSLSKEAQGKVKIAIYETSQAIQDNIRYKNASYIGLTRDSKVNDTYVIEYENKRLKVLYANSKGRYRQVYLGDM